MDESRERREAEAEAEADGRVLNSVVRLRILRPCLDEPLTNKEIADRLGKDPATVDHHVRRLAGRGFLAAQAERTVARGAREVPYLATKKSWPTPLPDGARRLLVETFLAELAEADPRTVVTTRLGLRLSPAALDGAALASARGVPGVRRPPAGSRRHAVVGLPRGARGHPAQRAGLAGPRSQELAEHPVPAPGRRVGVRGAACSSMLRWCTKPPSRSAPQSPTTPASPPRCTSGRGRRRTAA